MDLRSQLDMDVLDNVEETTISLGRGSYGEVKVVRHNGTEFAGKYFHSQLTKDKKIYDKCLSECKQAISIRHQNIVKTIGIFERGRDLVLIMEKLPYCLSEFVAREERELPEYIKHSILHDVSKGIHYLHSLQIMHRDLTANNILLTETLQAKITDFGQAKFMPFSSFANSAQTPTPGTIIYMPPEALGLVHDKKAYHVDLAEYNFSIDVFSFGVMILHVYLRELPQPGGRYIPMGQLLLQRPPLEYFEEEIEKAIPDTDPMHSLLCQCLQLEPGRRPKPEELVCTLKQLLDNSKSVFKRIMGSTINYSNIEQELMETKEQLNEMTREVEMHGEENIKLKEQWRNLHKRYSIYQQRTHNDSSSSLTTEEYTVIENNRDSPNKQSTHTTSVYTPSIHGQDASAIVNDIYVETITKSLSKVQQENSMFWEENKQLRQEKDHLLREVDRLTNSGRTDNERSASFDIIKASLPSLESIRNYTGSLPPTVECTNEDQREFFDDGKKLNIKGARKAFTTFTAVDGANAVLLQGKIYMGRATRTILAYDRILQKWETLPKAPVKNYALANYQGQLVIVGGANGNTLSGSVYCFDNGQWLDRNIPAMNLPRENAVAFGFDKHLIVLGGVSSKAGGLFTSVLKNVEVYWEQLRQWYTGPDLPRQGLLMQSVSADRHLYILHSDGWTVRYCSLDQLVNAAKNGCCPELLWHKVEKRVPYTRCSLAVYNNTLLALAGAGSDGHIYGYNPRENTWTRLICSDPTLPSIKNACCLQVGQLELFLCGGDIEIMNQTGRAAYQLIVEESGEGVSGGRVSSGGVSGGRVSSGSVSGGRVSGSESSEGIVSSVTSGQLHSS